MFLYVHFGTFLSGISTDIRIWSKLDKISLLPFLDIQYYWSALKYKVFMNEANNWDKGDVRQVMSQFWAEYT
jgi:hypothetical protein